MRVLRRLRAIGAAGSASLVAMALLLAPALAATTQRNKANRPAPPLERPPGRRLHAGRFRSATRRRARPPRHQPQQRFPLHARRTCGDRSRARAGRDPRARRHAGRGARAVAARPSATPVTAITPSSYNLGVSLGWRRFAISGDVAQSDGGLIPGTREFGAGRHELPRHPPAHRPGRGRRRARRGRPAHDRRRPGLFARRRRRLSRSPATSMSPPAPATASPATGSSRCRATSAATARPSMSAPPSASNRPATQASIPAQP